LLRERFSRPLDRSALVLSGSTREDATLLYCDLWASSVHARMLGATGIIPQGASRRIVRGLRRIGDRAVAGRFPLLPRLEDVHLNVESALTRDIGPDGERLHTGRSRNDQVATDLLLYLRSALLRVEEATAELVESLLEQARSPAGRGTVPGWTHMQPAQRVYWSQILGSHALRFMADGDRLGRTRTAIRFCPLGSAALAGTSLPIDRTRVAHELGFDGPTASSYGAVADRDPEVEALFDLALLGVHASQLAEELVIGAMPEVGRVRLADPFVSTSSLMPHKRNPDLAELVRAEAAPAIGRLVAHLALLKGVPLSYQRDLQVGKPLLFDGVERTVALLDVLTPMIATSTFCEPPPAGGEAAGAVEVVDALVAQGIPFREAHGAVARVVRELEESGLEWAELRADDWRMRFPTLAGFSLPTPGEEPERRTSMGGSSWEAVESLLGGVERDLARWRRQVQTERKRLAALRRSVGIPEPWFADRRGKPRSRRSAEAGRGRSAAGSRPPKRRR
jgi:argininosuccinate lyase